ncbi:hypothetical protein ACFSX9_08670 [Flavobacterium ardleyense]|uniref:Lipoprotein n=1 Tax=Flavobacterium ardleyense TaxID=2038737 RepID=A0ABW5Z7F6_9FLAO
MKTLKSLLLCLIVSSFTSCDNDNDPTNNVCDETYLSLAGSNVFTTANGYELEETMDLLTHEYTMIVNASGEICSIGYQNAAAYIGTYEMEVENMTTNVTVTETLSFSQTAIEYKPLAVPLVLNAGDTIAVRRTFTNTYTSADEIIGNLYRHPGFAPIVFPIALNPNATLIGTSFYGTGGPSNDFAIPVIGVGFKLN